MMVKYLLTKKSVFIMLLLISSFFMVSMVSADTLSGTGWLYAQGNGVVVVKGDVDTLHIRGNGILYYKDAGETDTPTVTGTGRRIELPNGWVQYIGFNGTFHLTDADQVIVRIDGRNIHLYAEGTGDVWLRGEGHYRYHNGEELIKGSWPAEGQSLEIAPAE